MIKRKIHKGKVHIVENEQGSIYSLSEDSVMVHIRQMSVWSENSTVYKQVSNALYPGGKELWEADLKRGMLFPGTIVRVQQTEPVDIDNPEDYLLKDKEGNYIKTPDNEYIWEYNYYTEAIPFDATADTDILLCPY